MPRDGAGSGTSCGGPETARGAARAVSLVYLFSFLVVHTFLKCPECVFLFSMFVLRVPYVRMVVPLSALNRRSNAVLYRARRTHERPT